MAEEGAGDAVVVGVGVLAAVVVLKWIPTSPGWITLILLGAAGNLELLLRLRRRRGVEEPGDGAGVLEVDAAAAAEVQ